MATIRLYSDFVCPFCFLAERTSLAQLKERHDVDVDWRGFELHPDTPPGGMSMREKFGARATQMQQHLLQFAAGLGVTNLKTPDHVANTRRALALCELGRDEGKLFPLRDAIMDAYWLHGRDVENAEVLVELAVGVGLDAERARKAIDDPGMLARVDALQLEARRMGVRGIPTFIIGGYAVVGCQPVELLESALEEAGLAAPKA